MRLNVEHNHTFNSRKKPKPFYLGLVGILIIVVIASAVLVQSTLDKPEDTGKIGDADKTNDGPIKVELTTDKTTYTQGKTIKFSISAENTQEEAIIQPNVVSIGIKADNGNYTKGITGFTTFAVDYPPTLEPHSKTLLETQPWRVEEAMEPGSYTATVNLSGNNINCETTCTFKII